MRSSLRNLDFKNAGAWPRSVKATAAAIVALVVLLLGWQLVLSGQREGLNQLRAEETSLREEFDLQATRAASLEPLKVQLEKMEQVLAQQLRQLPTKTEMPELIVDVSRVALSSGIKTELFEPEAEQAKEFYAEKPIRLRMIGSYHQFGDFVSAVASLPRVIILTSEDLSLTPRAAQENEPPAIVLEGTVKTFRALDEAETLEQEKLAEEARRKDKLEKAKAAALAKAAQTPAPADGAAQEDQP